MKASYCSSKQVMHTPTNKWSVHIPTTDLAKAFSLKDVKLGYGNAVLAKYHDQPKCAGWITLLATNQSVFVTRSERRVNRVIRTLDKARLNYEVVESARISRIG